MDRFLVQDLPPDARVVGLVYPDGQADQTAMAAAAIASAVGLGRGHTLLAAVESSVGSSDEVPGRSESPGLIAALEGRARLPEVAIREENWPYTYLPAGGKAPPAVEFLSSPEFRRFALQVRSKEGMLLLHMPERALRCPGMASLLDGYVGLGELTDTLADVVEYGRAQSDEMPANRGPAAGRWGRHRARSGPPVVRIVLSGIFILVLAVSWWLLAGETLSKVAGPNDLLNRPLGFGSNPIEPPAGASAADANSAGVLLAAVESAPELPYSVLIASYARASDAEQAVAKLSQRRGALFFIVPTPVRGALYHRIFAGALPTRAQARSLMEELVGSGIKSTAADWDVRPARLAFRLGVFADRAAVGTATRELAAAGTSAYVVEAPIATGDSAFVLYAGAYESESDAEVLRTLLERSDRRAPLVTRRGEAR